MTQRIDNRKRNSIDALSSHKKICALLKNGFFILFFFSALVSCTSPVNHIGNIDVRPSLEYVTESGGLYTPSTQSLLRGKSWLESVKQISIDIHDNLMGELHFKNDQDDYFIKMKNIPMDYLVPRLHYNPGSKPEPFDTYNLMLAEFSRNSVSFPLGSEGDRMTHYQTNLTGQVPWKLKGDYEFEPNYLYKPLRMSVINNCLKPGLWELSANDRSGEVYHSWFNMPAQQYFSLVSKVNQLPEDLVRKALDWNADSIPLNLGKLRSIKEALDDQKVTYKYENITFSSQGSRRKISRHYAKYEHDGTTHVPHTLKDFATFPFVMSNFNEPGIYEYHEKDWKKFDFRFLYTSKQVEIKIVQPKTSFNWNKSQKLDEVNKYIELKIKLANDESIIIGNLPLFLLVKQEDFTLNGFGVGILNAGGLAERRQFLIKNGPSPSFAYLAREINGAEWGLNSHDRGIEQIFIRSYPDGPNPYWEVTITSYERIIDLVKYQIPIPTELINLQKEQSKKYIPPIYFTYRDNNVN